MSRFKLVAQFYKEAIKRDAHNADAYNNLAWLYYVKGNNLDEAEKLAKKALELNPSKKNIYGDTLEKIKGIKSLETGFGINEFCAVLPIRTDLSDTQTLQIILWTKLIL